jgi:hypothetical protein
MEPQPLLSLKMKHFSAAGRFFLFFLVSALLFAETAGAQAVYENYTATTLAGADEDGPGCGKVRQPFGCCERCCGQHFRGRRIEQYYS